MFIISLKLLKYLVTTTNINTFLNNTGNRLRKLQNCLYHDENENSNFRYFRLILFWIIYKFGLRDINESVPLCPKVT